MLPSGTMMLGNRLTAVDVQSTIGGTPSIAGYGPWSIVFQSSHDAIPLRSQFCLEYGVIMRLWPLG